MPPDLAEQLRAWIGSVAREEVTKAVVGLGGARVGGEYLSSAEAAALARVTQATIRRWIREGRLEQCGAGREVRVQRVSLEKLMRPGKKRIVSRNGARNGSIASPEVMAARKLGMK